MSCSEPFSAVGAFDGQAAANDATASPPSKRCVLVVTRLAPGVGAAVVSEIFKRSRESHSPLAITGTMLFDGERVGMLFCGPPEPVGRAVDALVTDPRQAAPQVLADADQVPPWAAPTWHAGWCEPDALAPLTAADAPKGPAAVEAWRALMVASDLL